MLKEHEKLWAFLALLVGIALLSLLGSQLGDKLTRSEDINETMMIILNAKLRIIDGAVTGLIAIAGMAAQALFRSGPVEKAMAETNETLVDKLPPPTGDAAAHPMDDPLGRKVPTVIESDAHTDALPEGVSEDRPSWER